MTDFDNKLLSHFLNPKNVGIIENANGYGSGENPVNGYRTDFYVFTRERQDKFEVIIV